MGREGARPASQVFGCALIALALAVVARLCVGPAGMGWPGDAVVRGLRVERLLAGVLVGVSLAWSGVALQALLRNALAEPYILGLSTGAGAGYMAQAALFYRAGWAIGPGYVGAVGGSLLSVWVVYRLSRRHGVIDPLGLLLTGVIVSTIGGALILTANAVAGPGRLRDDLVAWMMGELGDGVWSPPAGLEAWGVTGSPGAWVAALAVVAGVVLWRRTGAMDVASLSADEARALGVPIDRLRRTLLVTGSLLAAGAVVLAGPVAFVGLIAPHAARTLAGPGHRRLLPLAGLLGAALVVLADTLGHAVGAAFPGVGRLPLGVFTALVGGPVFLVMLRPRLGRGLV